MSSNSTISPRFKIDIEKFKDWTDDIFLDLVKEPGHTYTNDEEEALVYMELYIRVRNNDWHVLRMFKRNVPFPRWYAGVAQEPPCRQGVSA